MNYTKEQRREIGRKVAKLREQGLTWDTLQKRFGSNKRQLMDYMKEAGHD